MRYYASELGRWVSRDPIGEDGGKNLYLFCRNTAVSAVDLLGQRDMPGVPFAFGITAGGSAVLAALDFDWLVAGSQTAIVFFPTTCEVAAFSVLAGLGENLAAWRPLEEGDFDSQKEWLTYQAGLYAGLGVELEGAAYIGGGLADADSFQGIFHTIQGAMPAIGGSVYVGDVDQGGRLWTGGTISVGPGIGLAKIDWNYQHGGNVADLDDDYGLAGRCACLWLRVNIAQRPNAIRYF